MFRDSFKYYKGKNPPPDLRSVLAISENCNEVEVMDVSNCQRNKNIQITGLTPVNKWQIFRIKNNPGIIFIKNPFTGLSQRYWISRCLRDFSKKPYVLNIDAHNYLSQTENWWEICQNDPARKTTLINKLRWSTLGYHHNWDTKIYSESSRGAFPEDLLHLSEFMSKILGFDEFMAQAAIVNYYHMNSTLSGHTDHSEKNLEAPLFSFSFGQSAIFLIGGPKEEDPATPILIESGDVLVMSGVSRLCYHAVPKILAAENQPWNQIGENIEDESDGKIETDLFSKCTDDGFWKPFQEYIMTCRLNMNVRQVLNCGKKSLDD